MNKSDMIHKLHSNSSRIVWQWWYTELKNNNLKEAMEIISIKYLEDKTKRVRKKYIKKTTTMLKAIYKTLILNMIESVMKD